MKLMQIVLAGQPQLADRLASPSMAQLRQRISIVMRIEPFTAKEVDAYIDHRLWIGGCDRPSLFTPGARKLIAEHSEGIPRNINNLCFNALSLGCALQKKNIDRDIILEVISDLDLEPLRENPTTTPVQRPDHMVQAPRQSVPAVRKQSMFAGWLFKIAIASALLLTLSWAAVPVNRRSKRAVQVSSVVPVPAAVAPALTRVVNPPAPAAVPIPTAAPDRNSPVATGPAPNSVRVMPGETLYRLSVKNLGRYDRDTLNQIRGLNPWLNDPDRIQSGRQIRMPSVIAIAADGRQAAAQSNRPSPTEAGKP